MAIAFDAATTDTYVGQTSRTIAHACTGSDRFLLVTIAVYSNVGSVTGATYNGVAMTQTGTATASGGAVVYQYALANPASGTNNVIVSLSGPSWYYSFAVTSYTGVDQSTPYGTPVTANGPVGAPTVDVSSASGELVVDSLSARFDPSTPGAGQTQRALINNTVDGSNIRAATSEEAGAGTVTMSWAGSGATWATVGLPLKPAAGAPPPTDITGKGQEIRTAWAYLRGGSLFLGRSSYFGDADTADSDYRIDFFFPVAAASYSLTADLATFATTTFPAVLARHTKITAAQASFNSTFQPVGLAAGRRITADVQTYASTFQPAAITRQNRLTIAQAAFDSTFQPATITHARKLAADGPFAAPVALSADVGVESIIIDWEVSPGFYSDFRDAGLSRGYSMTADLAEYVSDFRNAFVYRLPPTIFAGPAFVTPINLTGEVVAVNIIIDWDIGPTFTSTPQSAAITHERRLSVVKADFVSTGQDANFSSAVNPIMPAALGTFASAFQDAGLFKASNLQAALGSFTSTGQAANLTSTNVLPIDVGNFGSTFLDAVLTYTRPSITMNAETALFVTTGPGVGLFKANVLSVTAAQFVSTGQWVDFYLIPTFTLPRGATYAIITRSGTGLDLQTGYTGIVVIRNYSGIDLE